jgi:hypothetical protein
MKFDKEYAIEIADEIFSRTYPSFMSIQMWPSPSNIPEKQSDSAILSTRTRTAIEYPEIIKNGQIQVSVDLMTAALSTEFINILKKDLDNFGLVNAVTKTLKVRHSIPKNQLVSLASGEEVADDDELKPDEIVIKGEPYITGNIKLYFSDQIRGQDLREYLEIKGYDVGKGSKEVSEEPTDDDEDDVEDEEKNGGEEIKEQRANINKSNDDLEDDNKNSIESEKETKEAPIFATKKAVVVDNVDKLMKSIDEFVAVIKKSPETELSDIITVFSSLIDQLNEYGLAGK